MTNRVAATTLEDGMAVDRPPLMVSLMVFRCPDESLSERRLLEGPLASTAPWPVGCANFLRAAAEGPTEDTA
jgi:hypothetical protein